MPLPTPAAPTEVPVDVPADVPADPARLARLEDELTTLTAHINAATARFLRLLEEFDRLEGWRPHGLVSTAHWLHWRCGFGLNAAREKVRVARSLAGLPRIRACFETGSLSYSKVRAMTRIATPANEHVLLQVARHGTTRHVETLVSKWRGAEQSRELRRAGRQHAARSLRWHYDEDGCLVVRATLPPEEGALFIEAIEAALQRLEEGGGDDADDISRAARGGTSPVASEDSLPRPALADDVSAETSVTTKPAARVTERGDEVHCTDRPSASNPSSFDGVPGSAEDVSAETSPLTPGSSASLDQRRADALVFLAEGWLAGDPSGRAAGDAYLVNVHIDHETLAGAAAGRSELAEGPGLAAATVRRLCCDGGLVTHLTDAAGQTLDVGRKTRVIPPAMRRALRHRDRCCRFPGCTRTRRLDGHHVVHWADGGATSVDNLVLLCRHHHRLIHEGAFGAHADATGRVRFTTPAGAVIPDAPAARPLGRRLDGALEAFQLKRGLTIDARTAASHWRGEPMDYDHAGWLLMQAESGEESAHRKTVG